MHIRGSQTRNPHAQPIIRGTSHACCSLTAIANNRLPVYQVWWRRDQHARILLRPVVCPPVGGKAASCSSSSSWTSQARSSRSSPSSSVGVQMSEVTLNGVVPYIVPGATGAVWGIVGAGGNIGAVVRGRTFRFGRDDPRVGFRIIGASEVGLSCTSFLLKIRGYATCFTAPQGEPDPIAEMLYPRSLRLQFLMQRTGLCRRVGVHTVVGLGVLGGTLLIA